MEIKIQNTTYRVNILFDRRGEAVAGRTGAVEIEVRGGGIRRRMATGVRVLASQWSEKRGAVIRHPEARSLNAKIKEKADAAAAALQAGDTEATAVAPRRASTLAPTEWIRRQIDERQIADNTRKNHEALVTELDASGLFRRWSDFTPRTLAMWEARLRKARGITKQSTIYDYHKRLRVYVGQAVLMGLLDENPYDRYKVKKGRPEDTIRYVTDEERARIEALDLTGSKGVAVARDMFLLACYTGLAYCDMVKLSHDDVIAEGGRLMIVDRRVKTSTPYHITLLPEALAILERYGWNMDRLSNQKLNAYLKGIGAAAGLRQPLTMHMGRHTFATWALNNGVPIEVVSKMLAHRDIATTQIYAKVLQVEVDKGFELLRAAAAKQRGE